MGTPHEPQRSGEDICLKPPVGADPVPASPPSSPAPPLDDPDDGDAPRRRGCARLREPRSLGALVLTLLVLALATVLLFGDSPEPLPDPNADPNADLNALPPDADPATDIKKGYIINAPTRCEVGYRFFRGKCRKVF